jgi:hypothetical protein
MKLFGIFMVLLCLVGLASLPMPIVVKADYLPIPPSWYDTNTMIKLFNSRIGQVKYDATYDLNHDGVINMHEVAATILFLTNQLHIVWTASAHSNLY